MIKNSKWYGKNMLKHNFSTKRALPRPKSVRNARHAIEAFQTVPAMRIQILWFLVGQLRRDEDLLVTYIQYYFKSGQNGLSQSVNNRKISCQKLTIRSNTKGDR